MAEDSPPLEAHGLRHRGTFLEMLVGAALSLLASFVLSVDALKLAANPGAQLSCNVSDKISCSSVGLSWQSSLFGFPNSFIGLMTEPVVITVAVAGLAGVRFPRWFMLVAQAFYTLGLLFALWLFQQSYMVIGALCPWCLLVTATTIIVFASLTRVNILSGNLTLPGRAGHGLREATRLGADIGATVLVLAVLAALAIYRYL